MALPTPQVSFAVAVAILCEGCRARGRSGAWRRNANFGRLQFLVAGLLRLLFPIRRRKSHGERKSERPHDAAKTNVASRRVDRLGLARRRPVAQAVVGRAEVRAAFHHPASGASPALARHTAGFSGYFAAVRGEATRGPLPHIADHVVEAIAVCGKGVDRRGALVAVELEILPGETALPGIGHRPPLRSKRFAPGVGRAVETAARGEFPFGLDG